MTTAAGDPTEAHWTGRLARARLELLEFATTHNVPALLTRTLDIIGELVESPIGFYHFVEADQTTLSLQAWSTRTLQEFCRAEGSGVHYSLDEAGVWVDCVKEGRPVVHNDFASLPHRKGLPEGHAQVVRELVVPVMREGGLVAILGVGNKPADYTSRDVETVAHLADVSWLLVEQKRAVEALEESERRLFTLMSNLPGMAYRCKNNPDWTMEFVSEGCMSLTGFPAAALIDSRDHSYSELIHPEDVPLVWEGVQAGVREKAPFELIYRILAADGSEKWVWERGRGIFGQGGEMEALEGFITDISELKKAETERGRLQSQLAQAQKMESVGRLAGGVAHDFNNMLSVILGCTELAMARVPPGEEILHDLAQIREAAERSSEITRQLLAFARKQTISPRTLDLNETVEGMLRMLRRLIGEDIDLAWLPETGLWPVRVDPSQIDQILANLCVNARDAISESGKITIETGRATFDESYCSEHPGFVPGEFVLLAVSDNGRGMDRETLRNLFEPFFTTKEEHEGTGLGLATVYGIVKQNDGFINVYSEPGAGTAFKIYLPRHQGEVERATREEEPEIPRGQGESILVVEDEEAILSLSARMLRKLGYTVVPASTPEEALRLAEAQEGPIDLLLTDVVMPGMNGRELAHRLQALYPGVATLFMSGYTANVIAHHGVLEEGVRFLQKPFTLWELAVGVRRGLEG